MHTDLMIGDALKIKQITLLVLAVPLHFGHNFD